MSQGELTKISAKTAGEVSQRCGLGDDAKALLQGDLTPGAFLDVLIEKKLHPDAAKFLAHALPKREAVWWACLCAELIAGAEPAPATAAALGAARAWVIDPNDENRRAAFTAAEAAKIATPAGCAALAAFLSGGSLSLPNLPAVPPAEHLTGDLVASSLALAAVITEPEKASQKYANFIKLGLEVAEGRHPWAEAPQPTEKGPTHGYARRPRR
ncbi:MAG TPA: hypothetical protein VKA15_17990 [Isosphaeraceae bacterium]|nr:hypothetical protein [Isosphaeraceae bacterium]